MKAVLTIQGWLEQHLGRKRTARWVGRMGFACGCLLALFGTVACDSDLPKTGLTIESSKLVLKAHKAYYQGRPFTGVAVGKFRMSEQQSHVINYLNGDFDGKRTFWHENGKVWQEWNYSTGKLNGVSRVWHQHGQIKSERGYLLGMEHGWHREWGEKGEVISARLYANGILVEDPK